MIYQLLFRFLDIDECETGQHTCEHSCNNTEGSYTCYCDDGFRLNTENNHGCDGNLIVDAQTLFNALFNIHILCNSI